MKALSHSWYMTVRHLRALMRQPWYIAITLVQPIIWLVLYGELFKKVVELPGFRAGSYIDFLAPGVIVMTALFASGWTGMGLIRDLNNGVMDRFLVTPVSRVALIAGRLASLMVGNLIQTAILVVLALIMGARFIRGPGALVGLGVLVGCSLLLAAAFGSLSLGLALTVRREESVIGAVNLVLLPLVFLSPVFMDKSLVPRWILNVARFNPVSWTVDAGRGALNSNPDWGLILTHSLYLAVLAGVCIWVATRAFRGYQRSV
ncbi:MAG TPA: ABC transporter permease [Blastocatellia bacterium]|nr:ABC transporter permease [Blastocatellia bacterium]